MPEDLHTLIAGRIAKAQRFAVVSHINPDGDAVGSVLGLGLALKAIGKQVWMALCHGVPPDYRFLPGADRILLAIPEDVSIDMVIAVDSGDRERLGSALPEDWRVDLNIDHHATNTHYGLMNVVEPDAPSTTAVLAQYLPRWGLPITTEVATVLLAGLITDTLGFRTESVTPDTLRLAADLMEKGAPLSTLYYETMVAKSFPALRYWGFGLARMQRQGALVWTYVTQKDREAAGYELEDDADLVNQLVSLREAEIALIFVERSGPRVKMSWRAKPGWDVSTLAKRFGGGGHAAAAGAILSGTLEEVIPRVLEATLAFMGQETHVSVSIPS